MADKPHALEQKRRELRERLYEAAPLIAASFPEVEQVIVELRFFDGVAKTTMTSFKQIHAPHMRSFFEVRCPVRECADGGFDLTADITRACRNSDEEVVGTAPCAGRKVVGRGGQHACPAELRYHARIHYRAKRRIAAPSPNKRTSRR